MKKKHDELVHIIRQQKQPISSTQLARLLNVTPRSVKNYVAAIQEEFPDLIAAGPRGYRIDTDKVIFRRHTRSAALISSGSFSLTTRRKSICMIFAMNYI